jgi:hypothetical protein
MDCKDRPEGSLIMRSMDGLGSGKPMQLVAYLVISLVMSASVFGPLGKFALGIFRLASTPCRRLR